MVDPEELEFVPGGIPVQEATLLVDAPFLRRWIHPMVAYGCGSTCS